MAKEDQKNVIFDENVVGEVINVDRTMGAPENLGSMAPENPLKNRPCPPKTDQNPRRYPGRFSDLKSFLSLSSSLVGTSNFCKVVEPSVGSPVLKQKRRYKLKKKEEVLVGNSSNTIKNYFQQKDSKPVSTLCKFGKRKLSTNTTEVLKKVRVGDGTIV